MATWTTNSAVSLEEQRINAALAMIEKLQQECQCVNFCESFGCATLGIIANILRNGPDMTIEELEPREAPASLAGFLDAV